mmetsp:Transcript_127077/g.220203  ORF Transcript_127077/g.220203 Transcript_127077/m.220203 type:complete len:205 (-) Transcript_127077:1672-2286(-)
MLYLEAAPDLPELLLSPRVTELGCMGVDASGAVHLAKHCFHLRISNADIFDSGLRDILYRLLVDLARSSLAKKLGGLPQQDTVHVIHVCLFDGFCCTIVDGKGMACQAMVLLQLCIEHVQATRKFRWNLLDGLFEQIPRSLKLPATIAFDKTLQVRKPKVVQMRPGKVFDALLVDLESIFEVLPILQETRVAQDERRRCNLQLN